MDLKDGQMQEILKVFAAEADEILTRMEQSLVQLEHQPGDMELVNGIFRGAHTLKGNAAALDFPGVAELCHTLEDVLDRLRGGQISAVPALTTVLLRTVDAVRGLLADMGSRGTALPERHRKLLRQLSKWLEAPIPRKKRDSREAVPEPPKDAEPSASSGAEGKKDERSQSVRTLRVDMQTLDTLLNLAGEIAISRDRLTGAIERLGDGGAEALELHRVADRLYAELQEAVARARMVPLGPTFRQHIRTVRDLADSRGKGARLVIEGDDVTVDATVIDYLREPLIHLIRNALDHGIESRDVRLAAGKDPTGTIGLRARREPGQIVVEASDDGAGLDREAILRKAVERGLVSPGRTLADAEIDRLVFAPGLSTSAGVTELSGRGVGLDVVRRSVEAVRGSLEIEGRSGHGTTITLRLPLTLAVIDGFHVVAGGRNYVLPAEAVVECREGPRTQAAAAAPGLTTRDGQALPFVWLAQLLASGATSTAHQRLVVVKQSGAQAGLVVDEILGSSPTVVKPLGGLFRDVPAVSGSTIRPNGEVALVLDIPGLLRHAHAGTWAVSA